MTQKADFYKFLESDTDKSIYPVKSRNNLAIIHFNKQIYTEKPNRFVVKDKIKQYRIDITDYMIDYIFADRDVEVESICSLCKKDCFEVMAVVLRGGEVINYHSFFQYSRNKEMITRLNNCIAYVLHKKLAMEESKVGDKISFLNLEGEYTIRACNERYLICVQVYRPECRNRNLTKAKYLYTIVDLEEEIRGTHNMLFNCYKNNDTNWKLLLRRLKNGDVEISHRNRVELDIKL